jgi:hypothetical protein
MLRPRWAFAVLAAGLGLLSGCSTLRDHPWFSRSRAVPDAAPCCEAPATSFAEGPILESGPPVVPAPNGALPPGAIQQPPGTDGQLRPVPQVPQAQPVPAQPSRRTPGIFIDRWKE